MKSLRSRPASSHDIDAHDVPAHRDRAGPARENRWTVEVHLARSCDHGAPLKILSVLHARRVALQHMHYAVAPDTSAVMSFECTAAASAIETLRKSLDRAVQVLTVTVHRAPPVTATAAVPQTPLDETRSSRPVPTDP